MSAMAIAEVVREREAASAVSAAFVDEEKAEVNADADADAASSVEALLESDAEATAAAAAAQNAALDGVGAMSEDACVHEAASAVCAAARPLASASCSEPSSEE